MPDLHDELAGAAERRQPAHAPAFAQVLETRRRRDRRSRAAGGAAAAVLVLAAALVVPGLTRGADDVLGPETDRSAAAAAALLGRCVGGDSSQSADDYVGLTEDEAQALAAERGVPLRVVGRDGSCVGIDSDLRPGRINALVQDGTVVGGSVEQAPSEPEEIANPIQAVRTDAGGRALVAAYVGGACDGPASLAVEEFPDRVQVAVQREQTTQAQQCILLAVGRTVQAELRAPLAGRDVATPSGRVLDVFDGSDLVVPAVLPEGFVLTGESGDRNGNSWTQTFSEPRDGQRSAQCDADARSLSVSTGPAAAAGFEADYFRDEGPVRVGASTARHYTQGTTRYLALSIDGAPVALSYSADCGGPTPSLPELVDIAESLRPATG